MSAPIRTQNHFAKPKQKGEPKKNPAYLPTEGVPIHSGQTFSGTFTASGGSGNDVDFFIQLYTCSQTIPFTANLVNSGGANGYAVVSLQIQSSSNGGNNGGSASTSTTNAAGGSSGTAPLVLNGRVFSEKYYPQRVTRRGSLCLAAVSPSHAFSTNSVENVKSLWTILGLLKS